MNTLILVTSILTLVVIILVGPQISYVKAQNSTNNNTTGLNITNSTGTATNYRNNSTTSNIQTSSGQGENDKGTIAGEHEPKCKGSALCPDW